MESVQSLSPLLGGVAGEYFVAAELSARGYIASITLRNTKGVDILCSSGDATKTIGIQVKTNKSHKRHWMLNQKAEGYFAENLFYVFVNLNDGQKSPDYFIVPSKTVAAHVREGNQAWLKAPGKKGQAHIESTIRHFSDEEEKFIGRWDLLGLGT